MRRFIIPVIAIAGLLAISCKETPEKRAHDIVSKLTIEEKASLMMHPSEAVEALGIPQYNWWSEALHGVGRNGKATVFPQPIGMAASFDTPLLEEVFTAVSDEGRIKFRQAMATGHIGEDQGLCFWTPNINIFRDPRWGRGMETYGEDPFLTGNLGMAVVRGLQGPADAKYLKAHACAKHFAVHSGPEWNRHSFDAQVSERDLRETYLPAFKDLVTKANVQEVMIAYNRFRGVPCGASDYLINTVLRGEWGYKGIVLSDCWAICNFYEEGCHGYSPDGPHAAAAAVHTGTDLNCGDSYRFIPDAVRDGLLDEADVDRSLERLISARIRLGELDRDITPWDYLKDEEVEGEAHVALARKIAQESLVLLQNKGGVLPLKADGQRIALVGPNADDREMQWGNYNGIPEFTVTLKDALEKVYPGLVFVRGCGLVGAEYSAGAGELSDICLPALDVKSVLKELQGIETVIFAGGISPRLEGEEMNVPIPGFKGGDRTDIELPQVQRALIAALHDAGKKVILVNFSGSAIGLEKETETCDAILQAWYPGEEGGNAVADVLTGAVSPSGRLPVTFYKNAGQLPDFEDYAMKGRTYRYFEGEPLFPFGFGLSYTTFSYGEASVKGGKLLVPVTNTGSADSDEVVQLYVRNEADAEGPVKSLRGFVRVSVPAGATVTAEIPLTDDTFLFWSEEKQDMVPVKSGVELLCGSSSRDIKTRLSL